MLEKTTRAAFIRAVKDHASAHLCYVIWRKAEEAIEGTEAAFAANVYDAARIIFESGQTTPRTAEVHSNFIKWHLTDGRDSYLYFGKGEQYFTDGCYYIIVSNGGRSCLAYRMA